MVDEDDYESLPEYASTTDHMIAGAAAGILEHTIIYPVDVIKVSIFFISDYSKRISNLFYLL
jgi:solute carrier family 25 (mitochondrial iron transporter), member 28/37